MYQLCGFAVTAPRLSQAKHDSSFVLLRRLGVTLSCCSKVRNFSCLRQRAAAVVPHRPRRAEVGKRAAILQRPWIGCRYVCTTQEPKPSLQALVTKSLDPLINLQSFSFGVADALKRCPLSKGFERRKREGGEVRYAALFNSICGSHQLPGACSACRSCSVGRNRGLLMESLKRIRIALLLQHVFPCLWS